MVREERPSDARAGMHERGAMHVDAPCVHAGSFERFSDEPGAAADVETRSPATVPMTRRIVERMTSFLAANQK